MYNSSLRSPIDFSELPGVKKLKDEMRLSEQTTMILEQISRDWCASAREFKFQILLLDGDRDWSQPARQLQRELPNNKRVGVRVRRLELQTSAWTKKEFYAAGNILRSCTKLEVLIVGSYVYGENRKNMPHRLLKPILFPTTPFHSSLHTLVLLSPLDSRSAKLILAQLPTLNLHALALRLARDVVPRRRPQSAILHNLESVEIFASDPSNFLVSLKDYGLPSLRRLSLQEQTLIQSARFTSFFVAHGWRLTILEVDCISSLAWGIFELCPNLIDIVTDVRFAVINQLFGHPNIQRIGFRGFAHVKESAKLRFRVIECFDIVFPFLLDDEDYPMLHTIRFLDFNQHTFGDQGWFMSGALRWSYWAKCSSEIGKRLEDHEGKLIKIEVVPSSQPFVDIR